MEDLKIYGKLKSGTQDGIITDSKAIEHNGERLEDYLNRIKNDKQAEVIIDKPIVMEINSINFSDTRSIIDLSWYSKNSKHGYLYVKTKDKGLTIFQKMIEIGNHIIHVHTGAYTYLDLDQLIITIWDGTNTSEPYEFGFNHNGLVARYNDLECIHMNDKHYTILPSGRTWLDLPYKLINQTDVKTVGLDVYIVHNDIERETKMQNNSGEISFNKDYLRVGENTISIKLSTEDKKYETETLTFTPLVVDENNFEFIKDNATKTTFTSIQAIKLEYLLATYREHREVPFYELKASIYKANNLINTYTYTHDTSNTRNVTIPAIKDDGEYTIILEASYRCLPTTDLYTKTLEYNINVEQATFIPNINKVNDSVVTIDKFKSKEYTIELQFKGNGYYGNLFTFMTNGLGYYISDREIYIKLSHSAKPTVLPIDTTISTRYTFSVNKTHFTTYLNGVIASVIKLAADYDSRLLSTVKPQINNVEDEVFRLHNRCLNHEEVVASYINDIKDDNERTRAIVKNITNTNDYISRCNIYRTTDDELVRIDFISADATTTDFNTFAVINDNKIELRKHLEETDSHTFYLGYEQTELNSIGITNKLNIIDMKNDPSAIRAMGITNYINNNYMNHLYRDGNNNNFSQGKTVNKLIPCIISEILVDNVETLTKTIKVEEVGLRLLETNVFENYITDQDAKFKPLVVNNPKGPAALFQTCNINDIVKEFNLDVTFSNGNYQHEAVYAEQVNDDLIHVEDYGSVSHVPFMVGDWLTSEDGSLTKSVLDHECQIVLQPFDIESDEYYVYSVDGTVMKNKIKVLTIEVVNNEIDMTLKTNGQLEMAIMLVNIIKGLNSTEEVFVDTISKYFIFEQLMDFYMISELFDINSFDKNFTLSSLATSNGLSIFHNKLIESIGANTRGRLAYASDRSNECNSVLWKRFKEVFAEQIEHRFKYTIGKTTSDIVYSNFDNLLPITIINEHINQNCIITNKFDTITTPSDVKRYLDCRLTHLKAKYLNDDKKITINTINAGEHRLNITTTCPMTISVDFNGTIVEQRVTPDSFTSFVGNIEIPNGYITISNARCIKSLGTIEFDLLDVDLNEALNIKDFILEYNNSSLVEVVIADCNRLDTLLINSAPGLIEIDERLLKFAKQVDIKR